MTCGLCLKPILDDQEFISAEIEGTIVYKHKTCSDFLDDVVSDLSDIYKEETD